MTYRKTAATILIILLPILLVSTSIRLAIAQVRVKNGSPQILPSSNQSESSQNTEFELYFPLLQNQGPVRLYFPLIFNSLPSITISETWTADKTSVPQNTFFIGDTIQFSAEGNNPSQQTLPVNLSWSQDSGCGDTEIYSNTIDLNPGVWTHSITHTLPSCVGPYTSTIQITHSNTTITQSTDFDVRFPSGIVVSTQQGFDNCTRPTIGQMQTWWDHSPYIAYNIYLGGMSAYCPSNPPADWIPAVAQQGWAFILTWVGPQSPCSAYSKKIDDNPDNDYLDAYVQGFVEGTAAHTAAEDMGFDGEKIIYYDLEYFSGADQQCRDANSAFFLGWVESLHNLGDKAGVYASPCNYMTDWHANSPRPDDVWIANWYSEYQYRPDATVWNVACMNNTYWTGQSRLRQYAGGHVESWGGVSYSVDSNVFNGEITALSGTPSTAPVSPAITSAPKIRAMGLFGPSDGWVLQGNQLWRIANGARWRPITPELEDSRILAVEFLDSNLGWLAAIENGTNLNANLTIFTTKDGGVTWETNDFHTPIENLGIVYLHFIDSLTGWMMIQHQTGSNFSVGQLFATRDGGQTWEARSAPLGEPVTFIDDQHGWVAGGPRGDQLFFTEDGGNTWQPQFLPNLPRGQAFIDLPVFENVQSGILPVTVLDEAGASFVVYKTENGGKSWAKNKNIPLPQNYEPGMSLPFSLFESNWRAAVSTSLLSSFSVENDITVTNLPRLLTGMIAFEFVNTNAGWAIVQDHQCVGEKIPFDRVQSVPTTSFQCFSQSRLLETLDGGLSWQEITP